MKHPFAEEILEKKYAYVIGVAMVVLENGELSEKQENYLKKLINNMGLTEEDLNKVLKFARQYQAVKNKVIHALDTPYKKYCFLMELYHLFYETNEEDKTFIKAINHYAELLEVNAPELNSIRQAYVKLGSQQKSYLELLDRNYKKEEIFLGKELLEYFTAGEHLGWHEQSKLEEEITWLKKEKILKKGEELIFTKACKISSPLKVMEGARLIFSNAEVEIHACIQIEGGYLEIRNTQFKVDEAIDSAAFVIMNTNVRIENSSFNGGSKTGIWCQINGELCVKQCTFANTVYRPCLTLWECPAIIKESYFNSCRGEMSGGAVYTNSNIEVLESVFEDCSAPRGAAIYRLASVIPWVETDDAKSALLRSRNEEHSKFFGIFGQKINFVPIPKTFQRIAYPIILKKNLFKSCKSHEMGVVCAYKSQVIINEGNRFEGCEPQSVYYYE